MQWSHLRHPLLSFSSASPASSALFKMPSDPQSCCDSVVVNQAHHQKSCYYFFIPLCPFEWVSYWGWTQDIHSIKITHFLTLWRTKQYATTKYLPRINIRFRWRVGTSYQRRIRTISNMRSKVSLVSEVEWKHKFLELKNRGVDIKCREEDQIPVEKVTKNYIMKPLRTLGKCWWIFNEIMEKLQTHKGETF